jgi:hypothetical protein
LPSPHHQKEVSIFMSIFPARTFPSLLIRGARIAALVAAICLAQICAAQGKPAAPNPAPDVLILSNGDTLHGKFVSETGGKVTFHSDPLGDVNLSWDKIKELHVAGKFGVINQPIATRGKKGVVQFPVGTFDVADQKLTVHPENAPAPASIPVAKAQFIMDSATLDKQINHEPGFFAGWNGAATAGATLVSATNNQYTFTGAVNLVRTMPTAAWLDPRNKTLFAFNESYGKITQPAYSYPATPPATGSIPVAAVTSPSCRLRILARSATSISHHASTCLRRRPSTTTTPRTCNCSKSTAGVWMDRSEVSETGARLEGYRAVRKAAVYSRTGSVSQNLIGSTFAANYILHLKLLTYTQTLSFIPAYNQFSAYSATETDTVAFPTYKNFSFSVGTLDSYLNDAPFVGTSSTPPTKPNSFQFTMGLTYAIKSKY